MRFNLRLLIVLLLSLELLADHKSLGFIAHI